MIEFDNVSLSLGDFSLKNCSLKIDKGEFLAIMGPSGAGKTIILELIAGLHEPDSGVIRIDGVDMKNIPPEKRGIGIVYQDYALFPHMTVRENICYGMQRQHIPHDEQIKRCRELADSFGIGHLLSRRPMTLSGGEAQRAALCRALAVKPSILLLDEPYAALDNETRQGCIADMKKLHKNGLTIIQVTHSLEEARSLGTRIALIRDGQVIQTGTSEEVFMHPGDEATARFLGFENIFDGKSIGLDERVCVRSEDLILHPKESGSGLHGTILSTEIIGALRISRIDTESGILTAAYGKHEGEYRTGSQIFVEIPLSVVHQLGLKNSGKIMDFQSGAG
ncbi:tungstate/molybdate transport system ATP-binding protein [Methanocorpusculum labreanum Z]|uniref:Molybdate/tungstate import ATP-binding protein WtpC n=1 Tax=Methanocorpusculum labreanum (strain ATCC 43576 / DSM 4855 / Z) TaxID=410358 RepID=A2SS87_METLZ|nr:ATP-binding cassette domain-containing protein [Methanocorpusculum labreanum]ABN07193.1 tungstate/molybdate transport system ATP-binding protein [Methanocorpusculum labreanum Z]